MTEVTLRTGQVVSDTDLYNNQHEVVFLPCVKEAILSAGDAITAAGQAQTALNNLVTASGANATSATALTIGLGSQSLTVQPGKNFAVGHTLKIASSASPANYMVGDVVSYNNSTGAVVVNVTFFNGSGSASAWTVTIFAGSSTGGAVRNYVFNGDCRINIPLSFTPNATYDPHDAQGFYILRTEGNAGGTGARSAVFAINGKSFAGIVASSGSGSGTFRLMTRIAAQDTAHLLDKGVVVSFVAYHNQGSPITLSVNASAPTTTADTFSALTSIATGLGSTVVPSGVPTKITAVLPVSSAIIRGLQIEIVPAASINVPTSTGVYGITDVKVGLDSNFEPNDADIVKALIQYERSYPDATLNAATSLIGAKRALILAGGANLLDATVVYKQKKRRVPDVFIYSPNNGSVPNVAEYTPAGVFVANRALASLSDSTQHGFNLTITGGTPGNYVAFHWVAAARL